MHDYDVVWSRESIYDVADIADYIELRFGRDRADRFNSNIDDEGKALGRNFRMYAGTGIYYRKKRRNTPHTFTNLLHALTIL